MRVQTIQKNDEKGKKKKKTLQLILWSYSTLSIFSFVYSVKILLLASIVLPFGIHNSLSAFPSSLFI